MLFFQTAKEKGENFCLFGKKRAGGSVKMAGSWEMAVGSEKKEALFEKKEALFEKIEALFEKNEVRFEKKEAPFEKKRAGSSSLPARQTVVGMTIRPVVAAVFDLSA
jgi:hypothetical protein